MKNRFSRNKLKFLKDVISTSFVTSLAKGLGLLVPIFISRLFGATKGTDIFFLSYAFIMFFTITISTSLETILVPFIVEKKENKNNLRVFIGQVFGLTFISFLVISIVGIILIKPIMSLITHYDSLSLMLLRTFYLEALPVSIFVVWNSIFIANLNAHEKFIAPASSPIVRVISILIIILVLHQYVGLHAVPIGYSLGEFLRFIFLYFFSKKNGLDYFKLIFKTNKEFLTFFKILSFQMIALLTVGANPFIDKTIATWTQNGGVSILEYAQKIYLIPIMLLSAGIFTVILPRWASINFQGKNNKLKKEVNKAILITIPLAFIILTPLILFSKNIVNLFYADGITDIDIINLIDIAAVVYMLGVLPYIMGQFVIRALLAMKLTRGVMIISGVKTFFNIFLDLLLIQFWGVIGIVISTSINSVIVFIITYFYFLKKNKLLNNYTELKADSNAEIKITTL